MIVAPSPSWFRQVFYSSTDGEKPLSGREKEKERYVERSKEEKGRKAKAISLRKKNCCEKKGTKNPKKARIKKIGRA